jgi:hypothetical protein
MYQGLCQWCVCVQEGTRHLAGKHTFYTSLYRGFGTDSEMLHHYGWSLNTPVFTDLLALSRVHTPRTSSTSQVRVVEICLLTTFTYIDSCLHEQKAHEGAIDTCRYGQQNAVYACTTLVSRTKRFKAQ